MYRKIPFDLKNVGATFQRAMSYAFNDINKIVEVYLDDLKPNLGVEMNIVHIYVLFSFHVDSIRLY